MLQRNLMAAWTAVALLAPAPLIAADAQSSDYQSAVSKATSYLRQAQAADGSYSADMGPAVTAICLTGLMRNGVSVDDPTVAKGLKWLGQFIHDDGGIYMKNSTHRNYETTLTLMCLAEANKDGRYDKVIKNSARFLKGIQWDESEDQDQASFAYGGAGYGSKKRPDLNNTGHLAEALVAAGEGANSEAMKKLLIFVSRCQNLETEYNTTPWASKVNDGGFYYTPAAGGSNAGDAGKTDDGGLRSYGSMTYVGLKSMIYAGVNKDDPRVKAAVGWVKKNYDLDSNPNQGTNGLYYYYHTMAKALDAVGLKEVTDSAGTSHDWRAEMVAELAERQQDNGSWINKNERWLEGNPNLVTGYALLTLSYCKPDAK